MKFAQFLLVGFLCTSKASVIPLRQRANDDLAPLFKASCNNTKPDTYFVTLYSDHSYHDHFTTIGRNLENDNTTSFECRMGLSNFKSFCDACANSSLVLQVNKIRKDPGVEAVDEHEYWGLIKAPPASNARRSMVEERDIQPWDPVENSAAPWHLQAISAGSKLDNPTDKSGPATQIGYNGTVGGGQGVNIYIIDSGVEIEHPLFQGRAKNFGTCYASEDGDCWQDISGHGTSVAGCAAGLGFGTAQGATIINVKTFYTFNQKRDRETDPNYIHRALKAILKEHLENVENPPPGFSGSVINLSLGEKSKGSSHIRNVIDKLYMAGVPVVAAAGNEREAGVSADDIWPCKFNTICVEGISPQYQQDWYSSLGGNVTVFAPGIEIKTLDSKGRTTYRTGTSMAAPLVAGVLATFIGWENLGYEGLDNPNLVRSRLDANLLRGIITDPENGSDLGGAQNNMVTSGINYPGKLPEDPYNGVGEEIDNTYQTDYNPFEIATAIGDFTLNPQPTEDPQPTPIVGPMSTVALIDVPAAATTAAELDDNTFDSIGDESDDDTSEPTATATTTSDDRPKIITPTGDGHGCLYVGCPDDYICNTVGNCVLD